MAFSPWASSHLAFIEREKQPKILELLKKWTNIKGYHIVALFTDEEPVPEDLKDVMILYG